MSLYNGLPCLWNAQRVELQAPPKPINKILYIGSDGLWRPGMGIPKTAYVPAFCGQNTRTKFSLRGCQLFTSFTLTRQLQTHSRRYVGRDKKRKDKEECLIFSKTKQSHDPMHNDVDSSGCQRCLLKVQRIREEVRKSVKVGAS